MREAHVGIIREPAYLLLLLPRTDVKKVKFKIKVKVEKINIIEQSEDTQFGHAKEKSILVAHGCIKRNLSQS
jgi:hypothetical protein